MRAVEPTSRGDDLRHRFTTMTVGVTAGLLALAPLASASEEHDEPAGGGTGPVCTYSEGEASASSDISGASEENAVSQTPVAGDNRDNICGMLSGDDDGRTVLVDATDLAP